MSIASRLRNPKRPNQTHRKPWLRGRDLGLIFVKPFGLFRAKVSQPKGAGLGFGGCTRAERKRRKDEREAKLKALGP